MNSYTLVFYSLLPFSYDLKTSTVSKTISHQIYTGVVNHDFSLPTVSLPYQMISTRRSVETKCVGTMRY